jgi:hypothetical protein
MEIGTRTALAYAQLVMVEYLQRQHRFSPSPRMAKNAWEVSTVGGKPTKAINNFMY